MPSKLSLTRGTLSRLKKSYKKTSVLVHVLSTCTSILFFTGIKADGKWQGYSYWDK